MDTYFYKKLHLRGVFNSLNRDEISSRMLSDNKVK